MGRDGTEPKRSRIFHQCYLNYCKLQNLTPLTSVVRSGNGNSVDFCVDRIKYADWPPIINALCYDLSLHAVAIKCRQQVKTVLEHIDCERLAKTVNKRCVVLTNFMLSNLVEAVAQLLSNNTLLTTLLLEGLPLRIPYLNPLCQALTMNSSLQHLHLNGCLIGDAGCLAICSSIKAVLPNMATLDLSGCELTSLGAGYIAELVKFQKIHRYSENWSHTLRYRLPNLDSMGGLRRITVCANPQMGDEGVGKLLHVLSDDLWIKALDIQNCGITEESTAAVLQMLTSNKTLVVIDIRCNNVSLESLSKVRSALRDNERSGTKREFSWLASLSGSSSDRLLKSIASKTAISKDRTTANLRAAPTKYVSKPRTGQKEKDYAEALEEQLQAEISHRQQLEELNLQLVEQLKRLKLQMTQMWSNSVGAFSGSEQSLAASVSGDLSSSSGSESPISLDPHTVSYVQQAFKDIYKFIKTNQCPGGANGQCIHEAPKESASNNGKILENICGEPKPIEVIEEVEEPSYSEELRINIGSKRPQSSHTMVDKMKVNKTTKSAHLLGDLQRVNAVEMKLEMIERQMGDTVNSHREEYNTLEDNLISTVSNSNKKNTHGLSSPCSSVASESETLTCSPQITQRSIIPSLVNPRDVLDSSSDEDES